MPDDDDLRRMASQVADYAHDIAPEIARQRQQLADFKVPPPALRPPLWQRWLYWVGWWRLASGYQEWADWERRSSPGYFVVRVFGQAVLIAGLLALGIAVTPAGQRDPIWYATGWIIPMVGTNRRIHKAARPMIEREGQSRRSLALENLTRCVALAAIFTLIGLLPRILA